MFKLSPTAEKLLAIAAVGPVSLAVLSVQLGVDIDGLELALDELYDAGLIQAPEQSTKH